MDEFPRGFPAPLVLVRFCILCLAFISFFFCISGMLHSCWSPLMLGFCARFHILLLVIWLIYNVPLKFNFINLFCCAFNL